MSSVVVKSAVGCAACFTAIVLVMIFGLRIGAVPLTWEQVLVALFVARLDSPLDSLASIVVWELRLPRILLGGLVGASLAVAGVIMQAVSRNPIASPNLTGVVGGCALAVVISLHFGLVNGPLIPYVGMVGGILGASLTFMLAWQGFISPVRMALAGVAVAAFTGACVTVVVLLSGSDAGELFFWLAGGLLGRGWIHLEQVGGGAVIGLGLALIFSPYLNLLLLGDDVARSIGGRIWWFRLSFGMLSVWLTANVVAVVGPIGFVGLVIPHLTRLLIGNDQRLLLPLSALLGALLMVLGDLVARTIMAPAELPVGIIMALIGGPVFVWLIQQKRVM